MNYLKDGENYDRPFWPNAANTTIFETAAPVTEIPCSLASKLRGTPSSYAVFWNACKLLAKGASNREKADLFAGTAARIYRLDAI